MQTTSGYEAYRMIIGDGAGCGTITEQDIREQAAIHGDVTDEDLAAAINHWSETGQPVPDSSVALVCYTDGQCMVIDWPCSHHPMMWPDRVGKVAGWPGYDGEERQWWRLGVDEPETAWTVCFPSQRTH